MHIKGLIIHIFCSCKYFWRSFLLASCFSLDELHYFLAYLSCIAAFPSWEYYRGIRASSWHNLCFLRSQYVFPRKENTEKFYLQWRQRKQGKTPLFESLMKGKEFSTTFFQTLHELKKEIKGMKRERHEGPSRISSHEEIPST